MPKRKAVRCAPQGRAAVSNGRLFPFSMDGRSVTARRFRDVYEEIGSDMGGADLLSEGQRQLARRAAGLSVLSEEIESDLVRERPFSVQNYLMYTNSIRRVFEAIGLKRRPRDVSPTLQHYLQALPDRVGEAGTASEPSGAPGVPPTIADEPATEFDAQV